MMDPRPIVSEMCHPLTQRKSYDFRRRVKYYPRTSAPTRYYYIDFGISRIYPANCSSPREIPIWGGDKSVPEFQDCSNTPCDPFATDIYYLGNLIRAHFMQVRRGTVSLLSYVTHIFRLQKGDGWEFLEPLVADMVQDDPTKRPTIDEVAARYEKICASLSTWKLRSRIIRRKDWEVIGVYRAIRHAYRTVWYVMSCTPAIPTPRRQ